MKRPTGTTVPRKLELVNVRCVEASPSQWERPMTVSESQGAIDTVLLPVSGGADMPPPFWELEELIDQGFSHERALALLAAKRSGHDPAVSWSDLALSSGPICAPDREREPMCRAPIMVVLAGR